MQPDKGRTWLVADRPPKMTIWDSETMVPVCISRGLGGVPIVFGCDQILHSPLSTLQQPQE